MVLLGRGDLPNASSPVARAAGIGKIDFVWIDNSGRGKAQESDHAFVAAYCEEMNQWIYGMNITGRKAGNCTMDIPQFNGKSVQTYIGFIAADGIESSDSQYTGSIQME
jgi:Family of unknown function (DUF6266)